MNIELRIGSEQVVHLIERWVRGAMHIPDTCIVSIVQQTSGGALIIFKKPDDVMDETGKVGIVIEDGSVAAVNAA